MVRDDITHHRTSLLAEPWTGFLSIAGCTRRRISSYSYDVLSYLIFLLFIASVVFFLVRVGGVFPAQPRLRPLLQRGQLLATVVVVIKSFGGGGRRAVAVATAVDVVIGGVVLLALLSLKFMS